MDVRSSPYSQPNLASRVGPVPSAWVVPWWLWSWFSIVGSSRRVGVCTKLYGICREVSVSPKLSLIILPYNSAVNITLQG